jgi:hypothetical protein
VQISTVKIPLISVIPRRNLMRSISGMFIFILQMVSHCNYSLATGQKSMHFEQLKQVPRFGT